MNPLLNILDMYLTQSGQHATPAAWLNHIQDVTQLENEVLLEIYNRRVSQRNTFLRETLFAPPKMTREGITLG